MLDPLLYAALGVVEVVLMAHAPDGSSRPLHGRRGGGPVLRLISEAGGPSTWTVSPIHPIGRMWAGCRVRSLPSGPRTTFQGGHRRWRPPTNHPPTPNRPTSWSYSGSPATSPR